MLRARQQAGDGQHGARAAGFEVADLLLECVGHSGGAQALRHRLRTTVAQGDDQRALHAAHDVGMRAGLADAAVHAQPVLEPGRSHRSRQGRTRRAGDVDVQAGARRDDDAFAGVAVVRGRMQRGRRPGRGADQAMQRAEVFVGAGGIMRGHRGAADVAEGLEARIPGVDRELARTLLAGIGLQRRHQLGKELGKIGEDVEFAREPPQPAAAQDRAGDGACRGADDDIGRREVDSVLLQGVEIAHHPRDEIGAAAAQHEAALLPETGRGRVGNRMRQPVVPAGRCCPGRHRCLRESRASERGGGSERSGRDEAAAAELICDGH